VNADFENSEKNEDVGQESLKPSSVQLKNQIIGENFKQGDKFLEKSFFCEFCNKQYSRKNLKRHMLTEVHRNNKKCKSNGKVLKKWLIESDETDFET